MDRQIILEELKKVLNPYTVNKEALANINERTDLIKDLKINSANLIDIIIDAENQYDIEIDMDAAEKIHDVGSCIDVIMEKAKSEN
ncbi:MAG: acyl carrier protein [Ferruginibacter sp.]